MEAITEDHRTQPKNIGKYSEDQRRTTQELWYCNFSKDMHNYIVEATNEKLGPLKLKPLFLGEFLKYLGYWLAMAIRPLVNRSEYWGMRKKAWDM